MRLARARRVFAVLTLSLAVAWLSSPRLNAQAPPVALPADAAPQAAPADQAPAAPAEQGAATLEPEVAARRAALVERGLGAALVDDPAKLALERARRLSVAQVAAERARALSAPLARAQGAASVMAEQLADSPRRSRLPWAVALASYERQAATARASQDALMSASSDAQGVAALIQGRLEDLEEQARQDALSDEARRREEEARKRAEELRLREEQERKKAAEVAQQRAKRDAEQARERERAATTEEIKQLYAEQALAHDRLSELEASRLEQERRSRESLKAEQALFSTRKEELRLLFERYAPQHQATIKAAAELDQRFEDARAARRAAITLYADADRGASMSQRELARHEAERRRVQAELEALERDAAAGEGELARARRALLQTQQRRWAMEAQLEALRLAELGQRVELADQQIAFYKDAIEQFLPRVSPQARERFYDLARDENWRDALTRAELGVVRLSAHLKRRLMQLVALPEQLATVRFWGWVVGLLWRLALCVVALRALRKHIARYARSATEFMLKRTSLRAKPEVAIKLGEVLQHVSVPAGRFVAWTILLRYGMTALPELRLVLLIINAAYIFKLTTLTIGVAVLPRALREGAPLKAQAPDQAPDQALNQEHGQEHGQAQRLDEVDLARDKAQRDRARKLVRSAKVVIWFWLIVIYLPALVVEFIGRSVIWRVVDLASTWFLVLVVYSVLTTWKAEIAALFERLAQERLPRAVSFVHANKDRLWGVLVIALASIYVIGKEGARLGREYLLNRDLTKRLSNFIFRKKIELQQRDLDKTATQEVAQPELLPPEYRVCFEDTSLLDEVYAVVRDRYEVAILKEYDAWLADKRQGSVALVAETGMGKTTMLNHITQNLIQRDPEGGQVRYAGLMTKLVTQAQVMMLVQQLFDLPVQAQQTKQELVAQIISQPPRVLVLDDCHHMFLRRIEGFVALELFLELVNLTDGRHFWLLSFNRFAWYYLTRVRSREHFLGQVIKVEPWSEDEIQSLIWTRNLLTGKRISFTDLVVTHQAEHGEEFSYEVIKSSKGYFRLLHEFSQGNPRVALTYWLRSLKLCDDPETLQVVLFRQPSQRLWSALPDDYGFALTAIAQHGALSAAEIAGIINADVGFCEMALNYFVESKIVWLDARRRARLTPTYFRQVLKALVDSNYLYE